MDAKITKKRLGNFLSYEWIKVVAIALALVIVWTVLFSCAREKLSADRKFLVMNYGSTATSEFDELDDFLKNNKTFSYEVENIMEPKNAEFDVKRKEEVLDSLLSTGDGDVMFIPDAGNGVEVDARNENGDFIEITNDKGEIVRVKTEQTYLQEFLHSRFLKYVIPVNNVVTSPSNVPAAYQKKGLLASVEGYLKNFFTIDATTGLFKVGEAPDEEEAEKQFRERVMDARDRRFRNERLRKKGLAKELERLTMYRDAYNTFMGYMAEGHIKPTHVQVVFESGTKKTVLSGDYALNICPNEMDMDGLKSVVNYVGKDGESTVKNMNILFLNTPQSNAAFLGEKLLFVNMIISHYNQEVDKATE